MPNFITDATIPRPQLGDHQHIDLAVKTFTNAVLQDLEDDINQFLDTLTVIPNRNPVLFDIQFAQSGNTMPNIVWSALVRYGITGAV